MDNMKIVPFKTNKTKSDQKEASNKTEPTRLSQLKETLDQRLQAKLEREHEIETQRLAQEAQSRQTTKKLITGLFTALLLGAMASAGWALANKDNHLIQKDKEKLTSEYTQLKARNQQLERENAALLAKLDTSEKNAKALDSLSSDLSKAVDQLKANRTELMVKLDQSTASIEQLYKDKAVQAEAFKTLTETNQSLEISNTSLNEKISLLKNIFNQGQSLLSQSHHKQTPPSEGS